MLLVCCCGVLCGVLWRVVACCGVLWRVVLLSGPGGCALAPCPASDAAPLPKPRAHPPLPASTCDSSIGLLAGLSHEQKQRTKGVHQTCSSLVVVGGGVGWGGVVVVVVRTFDL